MSRYERSIKIAFDAVTGEILDADELFKNKKNGFEIRKQFHKDEMELYCCECRQKLGVSTSVYDHLHFKHLKGAGPCILKDVHLSPGEMEDIINILKAKESDRHKSLKNKIGTCLSFVEGVDKDSIAIDNRFIIRGDEKRRPDVYCKYEDKEIVFEIQLSNLSFRYLIDRHDFYKQHGIYLVWILDNFDLHKQSQLERDIKYLTTRQNFFKLDETVDQFKLLCEYKAPFITPDNEIHTKWITKSVHLSEVTFDDNDVQLFYYDYQKKSLEQQKIKENRDRELADIAHAEHVKRLKEEQQQIMARRLEQIKERTSEVRQEIRRLRAMHSIAYTSAYNMLRELDTDELEYFNTHPPLSSLDKTGNPIFFSWLLNAKPEDLAFIEFLFTCIYIELDVNVKSTHNQSAFQIIIQNPNIGNSYPLRSLFKRGYVWTAEDEALLRSTTKEGPDLEADVLIYNICSSLQNRSLVYEVFKHARLVCILFSAKDKKIIGFRYKPTEWVAFANNAAAYYGTFWEYIDMVFKHYSLWDDILASDRKGTFQKKVDELYRNMPEQDFTFDRLFRALFPELVNTSIENPFEF